MSNEAYCHLATNPGKGGISVIILWGNGELLRQLCSMLGQNTVISVGELVYGWLRDDSGKALDEVLLACPQKNILLLSGHGGTANSLSLLQYLVDTGFTEVATPTNIYLYNDTLSTYITAARTEGQLAVLLSLRKSLTEQKVTADFALKKATEVLKPRRICIVGAPNTGKSSLLNRLCGGERALVSPHSGTTLDAVEHWLDIGGYDCALVDTAGFRDDAGLTEQEAMRRGTLEIARCDFALLLVDGSRKWSAADDRAAAAVQNKFFLVVLNKSDLPVDSTALAENASRNAPQLSISCSDGRGLDKLVDRMTQSMGGNMAQISTSIFTGASLTEEGGCL